MVRTYQLRSADGSKDVKILADVEYDVANGKRIQIREEKGTEGLYRRALKRVLEAEARTSRTDGRAEARVGPENYNFELIGTEFRDNHKCYVLKLTPKHKSKFLLEGRAWVDADDYGLMELEGRTAASVSFWVGRPFVSQSFEKVGDFWLLARNQSVADARIVGRITMNIDTQKIEMGTVRIALAGKHRISSVTLD